MRGWSHGSEEDSNNFHLRCATGRFEWCWSIEANHASQWAAIESIAAKIGCTGETLREWVRQAERDAGDRARA